MNRRIMSKVLQAKHNSFLDSIKNENIRSIIDKNSIITGGSIASMLLNETIKDFDYYFRNKESAEAVARYYVNEFNTAHPDATRPPEVKVDGDRVKILVQSAGVASENGDQDYAYFENYDDNVGMDYVEKVLSEADETDAAPMEDMEKGKYRPIFMSQNAITLSDKVQLVIRFYGEPEEIHKNYDFIHCCNYWTSWDGKITFNPTALESLLCRELQYQGSLYPVCSVIRTRKFLKKGWHINAGQFLKMCFQISELDLSNINVLEEQLTGVDAAYFFQVLDYCKKRMSEDSEFKVTMPYLITIIDKIFG